MDFQQLVDKLKDKQVAGNAEAIQKLFSEYESNPEEWKQYVFEEKGKYTRNLVYECKDFNLMVLAWDSKCTSPIHDHANSHCIVKVLDGKLQENLYQWDLELKKETVFEKDQVTYMHDKIGLHSMHNPTDSTSFTLHLYSPPFAYCKTFDLKTKQVRASGKCIYHSIHGKKNVLVDHSKYDVQRKQ